ncbi:MAG: hypothetical protein ACXWTL_06335 [Methylobacter sp.]
MYLLVSGIFMGCTTLESRLSIEPYTKNKPMRNVLEQVAEEYCRQKRAGSNPAGAEMQPDFIFTTDGCSRWPDDSWVACCIAHDIPYWCGGSEQDRKEADQELMLCVKNKTPVMGTIIYAGVRLGGLPWLPTPWRWGYGWDNWPESYEKSQPLPLVKKLMEELKIHDIIEHHLLDSK